MMIVGGIWLASSDKPVAGLLTIAVAVGAVLGSAWYGKRATVEELQKKLRELSKPADAPAEPEPEP